MSRAAPLDNAIIYLIGHPGVGKLTVARALCALSGAMLVDNHLINNVIFSVVRADGATPLPPDTWKLTERVREAAFEAIETLAPPQQNYVLTNVLDDHPVDRAWYDRIVLLAERRGALFVPVIVTCDEAENARRVPSPERAANMKLTDAAAALERRRAVAPLPVVHANRLDIDTTQQPAERAAEAILYHVRSLA